MPQIQFPDFMAVTFGLVTYLIGEAINKRVGILRRFSIPDPVTGGLLVALLFYLLYEAGVVEVSFDTHARDLLLLVFFTGIGLNARIGDLLRGGKPLAILVVITTGLLLVQNLVGALGAWIAGLPLGMAVVLGSTSLLGGHGTIIAWSPELAARGLAGAPEIGIAMATLGLVVASVIGGPIGRFLIEPRGLTLRRARRGEPRRPLRHRAAARADHPQRADAHAADGLFLHHPRLPGAARGPRLRA